MQSYVRLYFVKGSAANIDHTARDRDPCRDKAKRKLNSKNKEEGFVPSWHFKGAPKLLRCLNVNTKRVLPIAPI